MGLRDEYHREMTLSQAKEAYENAVGVSPRQLREMQAEITRVEVEYLAVATAEVERLAAEENEMRLALDEQWTRNADAARDVRAGMNTGEITVAEGRELLQRLVADEPRLDRQAAALEAVRSRREAVAADPIEYREKVYRQYPTLPRPRWQSF